MLALSRPGNDALSILFDLNTCITTYAETIDMPCEEKKIIKSFRNSKIGAGYSTDMQFNSKGSSSSSQGTHICTSALGSNLFVPGHSLLTLHKTVWLKWFLARNRFFKARWTPSYCVGTLRHFTQCCHSQVLPTTPSEQQVPYVPKEFWFQFDI